MLLLEIANLADQINTTKTGCKPVNKTKKQNKQTNKTNKNNYYGKIHRI